MNIAYQFVQLGLILMLLSPISVLGQRKSKPTTSELKAMAIAEFKTLSAAEKQDRYHDTWEGLKNGIFKDPDTSVIFHLPQDSRKLRDDFRRLKTLASNLKTMHQANFYLFTEHQKTSEDYSDAARVIINPVTLERHLIIERKVLQNKLFTDQILLAIIAHELSHELEDGFMRSMTSRVLRRQKIFERAPMISSLSGELEMQTDLKAVDLLISSGFSGQLMAPSLQLFLTERLLPPKLHPDLQLRITAIGKYLESKRDPSQAPVTK
jgi:hypothetical protein